MTATLYPVREEIAAIQGALNRVAETVARMNDAGALVAPEKESRAERNRRMELLASIATAVTIPEESRLWTASDIAQYLSMGKRTVAEKLVFTPGFPAPVDIGSRRWYMQDVIEWARKRKGK